VLGEFIALVVSGGHTSLFSVEQGRATSISQTRDDALGECFDKIGKRLGLAFPGGAEVDRLAELATDAGRGHRFKVPRCGDTLDFSYSGLKTNALVRLAALEESGIVVDLSACGGRPDDEVVELLAGFRHAAVEQLVDRVDRLFRARPFPALAVSGGAAANRLLRRRLESWASERSVDLRLVSLEHSSDNAAMIAFAALLRCRRGDRGSPFEVDATSRLALS
jgi:N6-L-threonylcarbamoyladenine synthase